MPCGGGRPGLQWSAPDSDSWPVLFSSNKALALREA